MDAFFFQGFVGVTGLEPAASCSQSRRSSQLSYTPAKHLRDRCVEDPTLQKRKTPARGRVSRLVDGIGGKSPAVVGAGDADPKEAWDPGNPQHLMGVERVFDAFRAWPEPQDARTRFPAGRAHEKSKIGRKIQTHPQIAKLSRVRARSLAAGVCERDEMRRLVQGCEPGDADVHGAHASHPSRQSFLSVARDRVAGRNDWLWSAVLFSHDVVSLQGTTVSGFIALVNPLRNRLGWMSCISFWMPA